MWAGPVNWHKAHVRDQRASQFPFLSNMRRGGVAFRCHQNRQTLTSDGLGRPGFIQVARCQGLTHPKCAKRSARGRESSPIAKRSDEHLAQDGWCTQKTCRPKNPATTKKGGKVFWRRAVLRTGPRRDFSHLIQSARSALPKSRDLRLWRSATQEHQRATLDLRATSPKHPKCAKRPSGDSSPMTKRNTRNMHCLGECLV